MKRMLVAVLVPIIALVGWVVSLYQTAISGLDVRLDVAGYDPRDLLAGHFVQYRVDYGRENICDDVKKESPEICVCLGTDAERKKFHAFWSGSCDERPADTCSHFYLKGSCEGSRFVAGIERFYIPEEYSKVMMTVPKNSSISIALDGAGNAVTKSFYVGEQPLEEYAQELLKAQPVK